MQTLNSYIQTDFNGDKSSFADFLEVSTLEVSKWLSEGWYVELDKLFSPSQELPHHVLANNAFCSDRQFPLYFEDNAPEESMPSLVFDIRTGEIYVENVYGSPSTYFRTKLSFSLAKELTANEVSDVIDRSLNKFQKILNGASVEYNGSEFEGLYSSEAESWIESLQESLRDIESSGNFQILDDFDPFLESDPFGKNYRATCLEDIVRHIKTEIESSPHIRLSDDLINDPESAIVSYYNWVLSDSLLDVDKEVPDWIFELEEFAYFQETA
jgi:hypothetical protein